jgi:hypothetical protein
MATATPLVLPRTKVLWIAMGLKTIQFIVFIGSCALSANQTGQGAAQRAACPVRDWFGWEKVFRIESRGN